MLSDREIELLQEGLYQNAFESAMQQPYLSEMFFDGNIDMDEAIFINIGLRRLARDCPELLDKIEAGELSVNAAAIAAGIRKKPSQAEICVKAFRKSENRLEAIKLIVGELEQFEKNIVRDWLDC